MSTYFSQDFEKIAATVGKGPAHVIQYANRFEAAAAWYRLYCRAPKGLHPADTGKRMRQSQTLHISCLDSSKYTTIARHLMAPQT